MTIRFGDCLLDTDARRLVRGAREVHVAPKEFELLKILVENRPRAVSKAELLDRIWPGVFVSDASLARVVSNIRKAIGHCGDMPIVRTVHTHGYAFAATVEDERPTQLSGKMHRLPVCWWFCGTREFPLLDGEHVVGREANAAICLDSPNVSRRHARLVVSGRCATLEDLGSKNGSFVNGVRVSRPTTLQPGDDTRIGPFTLILRVDAESGSTQSELRWPVR